MDTATTPKGVNHEVEIVRDAHRVFAVLKVDGQTFTERLGLQIYKMPDEQKKRHLAKVVDRLIKRAGLRKTVRSSL